MQLGRSWANARLSGIFRSQLGRTKEERVGREGEEEGKRERRGMVRIESTEGYTDMLDICFMVL